MRRCAALLGRGSLGALPCRRGCPSTLLLIPASWITVQPCPPYCTSTVPQIVYRTMVDGDFMLTNRQPTLHKPDMMGHRARVMRCEPLALRPLHRAGSTAAACGWQASPLTSTRSEGCCVRSLLHVWQCRG